MDDINIKEEAADVDPTGFAFEIVDFGRPTKIFAMWSNEESKQLIGLYEDFISEVGPLKTFRHKKDMWNAIALQIPTKTSKQCEERFKTLLRRKKKGIKNVYTTGKKRKKSNLDDMHVEEDECQIMRNKKLTTDNRTNPPPFKEVQVWSNYETKLLMELYNRFICEVGPRKKFKHLKDMWVEISTNFLNKDARRCADRYKTVLKRKKKSLIKTIYVTPGRRQTIDFKAQDCAKNRLKIKRVFSLKNYKSKLDTNRRGKANKQKKTTKAGEVEEELTLSETLLQIAAKKEEGKERRHREKLEAIEKIQNMLQQILNSTKEK